MRKQKIQIFSDHVIYEKISNISCVKYNILKILVTQAKKFKALYTNVISVAVFPVDQEVWWFRFAELWGRGWVRFKQFHFVESVVSDFTLLTKGRVIFSLFPFSAMVAKV